MATLTRPFHRTFSRAKIVPRQPPSLVSALSPTSPLHKFFGGLEYPLIEAPTKAGPAWTATQLRRKSYDDLHKLWYVCLLRKTQQETIKEEMIRVNLYKAQESWKDDQTTAKIRLTMSNIKLVLAERQKAYKHALETTTEGSIVKTLRTKRVARVKPVPRVKNKKAEKIAKGKTQEESPLWKEIMSLDSKAKLRKARVERRNDELLDRQKEAISQKKQVVAKRKAGIEDAKFMGVPSRSEMLRQLA